MSEPEQITQAFHLIACYAERQGWIPIGWRVFAVGPWTVTVNGTKEPRDHLPPYHALIEHRDIVALMVLSPFGGTVGGWAAAEATFIADLERALAPAPVCER
jgi:hypothetical protein